MPTRREAMAALAALAAPACGGAHATKGPAMSQRTYHNPPSWAPAPGYTHAVSTGGGRLVFVSGQVPLDASGRLVGEGFEAQVRAAFENLKTVLAEAGASFDDVVKLTYFVVGLDDAKVKAIRSVRDGFLPKERRPASSLVGVHALFREDVVVEIEAVAELPPPR